jgi:hypothetical protein
VFLQTSEKDNVQHNICITVFSNLLSVNGYVMNRNSSGDIGKSYGLDGWSSIPDRGRDFSLLHSVQTGSGAPPAYYTVGVGRFFPGVKLLGREAEHSPPSRAEVKNGGVIPPLSHTSS